MTEKCADICFEAAHEVINLLYEHVNLESVTGPVPSWWFAVLCEYAVEGRNLGTYMCII